MPCSCAVPASAATPPRQRARTSQFMHRVAEAAARAGAATVSGGLQNAAGSAVQSMFSPLGPQRRRHGIRSGPKSNDADAAERRAMYLYLAWVRTEAKSSYI